MAARADVEPRAGPRGADRRGPERGRRGGRAALARCVRAPRYCQFRQQCSRSFSRVAPDRGRRGRHGRRYRRGCAARAVVAPQGEPAPHSCATGSEEYVGALDAPPASRRGSTPSWRVLWCPPELREEPHKREPLPLLELADVRGDLHCHTTRSDGKASVREMGEAARERGVRLPR